MNSNVTFLTGDCREVLRTLPDASVHCCVTSPPYWGLRSYTGDPGMIGLEPTFDEHLENLVAVFREVRRVLRDDGTLWLNYGDAYASTPPGNKKGMSAASTLNGANSKQYQQTMDSALGSRKDTIKGSRLKPKDLMDTRLLTWVGTRQAAQREQPRHETNFGVRVTHGDELRHLVELREVSRLGCAFAAGWHRNAGQVEGKIADGNEATACLLFVFSHRTPTADGETRREVIYEASSARCSASMAMIWRPIHSAIGGATALPMSRPLRPSSLPETPLASRIRPKLSSWLQTIGRSLWPP